MMAFVGLGVVAVLVAIGLKINESGPRGHGLELPSGEAVKFIEAKRRQDS
jgi:hypothetical protein